MNENLLARIRRFCFHLNKHPKEIKGSDIQEVSVALVITVGVKVLQDCLLNRRHHLLELLSEAVCVHCEWVEL